MFGKGCGSETSINSRTGSLRDDSLASPRVFEKIELQVELFLEDTSNEWMCNTAREIEAASQPLSHSPRVAGPATQPLSHSPRAAGPATLNRASEWLSG